MHNFQAILLQIIAVIIGTYLGHLTTSSRWYQNFKKKILDSIGTAWLLSGLSPQEQEWYFMSPEDRKRYPEKKPIQYHFD